MTPVSIVVKFMFSIRRTMKKVNVENIILEGSSFLLYIIYNKITISNRNRMSKRYRDGVSVYEIVCLIEVGRDSKKFSRGLFWVRESGRLGIMLSKGFVVGVGVGEEVGIGVEDEEELEELPVFSVLVGVTVNG